MAIDLLLYLCCQMLRTLEVAVYDDEAGERCGAEGEGGASCCSTRAKEYGGVALKGDAGGIMLFTNALFCQRLQEAWCIGIVAEQ